MPAMFPHHHTFGQDRRRQGETRAIMVIGLTAVTMVVEITAGIAYGSMALLADGLHMASHAAALTITAVAYVYARRHANDRRYSFGTGKVNALAGFTGALLLAIFAGGMAWESVDRLLSPVTIAFHHALVVAIVGLVVNVASVYLLGSGHHHHDHGEHEHEHEHGEHEHDHGEHEHEHEHEHQDHNLRSAHLHVLADAVTSVAAIAALLTGKYLGLVWMDPLMGIVGTVLVGRWSFGLLRDTSAVLLDRQASDRVVRPLSQAIESHADVLDLHVWSIGPGMYACILSVSDRLGPDPEAYREKLPRDLGLVHVTVEVIPMQD